MLIATDPHPKIRQSLMVLLLPLTTAQPWPEFEIVRLAQTVEDDAVEKTVFCATERTISRHVVWLAVAVTTESRTDTMMSLPCVSGVGGRK
jgi:hypothetical protein